MWVQGEGSISSTVWSIYIRDLLKKRENTEETEDNVLWMARRWARRWLFPASLGLSFLPAASSCFLFETWNHHFAPVPSAGGSPGC